MTMNIFASLEDVLSPVGEPKAPVVGMMVDDWDENTQDALGKLVNMGYAVNVNPTNVTYSHEDIGSGIIEDEIVPRSKQVITVYYKNKPQNVIDNTPVITYEDNAFMLSINDRKVLLDKDSLESAIDANQLT